ncbi:C-type mannose receptor 2-like isoform X1 [Takifugu flavidus]|uniref:C-type mannose receptor 2-like isoform X1 n=1 Tax=Takifugu flavidus TaxID=433684 RepID=UPI002544401E|nr:C-type mannose receptor 2-like isoform X1 [Takifugu flavidus]XP_056883408.1 C-type mannose receptor 2-like isoform X1 [Takifugu flavidus]
MDYGLVTFVLAGTLVSAAAQTRQYFFVSTELIWTEAQTFCRNNFTDLATIENTADVGAVLNTTAHNGKAWIGLHDELINSWSWSLENSNFYGAGEANFRNWNISEPDNFNGQEYCVALFGGSPNFGTWGDVNCTVRYRFICYRGLRNVTPSFIKIYQYLSWYDAQTYCRENYDDLASIRNHTENAVITSLAGADIVWIGLHRDKQWSDGSPSKFRYWAPGQPDSGDEECVTTAFNNSGLWSDDNCSLSFPFICYKTIPPNAANLKLVQRNETALTLQWDRVKFNVSFILQSGSRKMTILVPYGNGPISYTVSSLTPGTQYTFILFSVLDHITSSGVNITAVTAPLNTDSFSLTGQDETSISLQWNKVNDHSFILQFYGAQIYILPLDGPGPVNYTVFGLRAGTEYIFMLFTEVSGVTSTGVNLTAVTAPLNTDSFSLTGQNETSISLQWNKVNNHSFILQFNGSVITFFHLMDLDQ